MKKRGWRALIGCLLALFLCVGLCCPAWAATEADASVAARAQRIADDILAARLLADGAPDLDTWAAQTLPDMIGVGGEWYAIALHQRGGVGSLATYNEELQRDVRGRQDGEDVAVVRQRYAMALLATGGGGQYLSGVAADTVGALGHMSYVYGLHLLHNGITPAVSEAEMLSHILAAQASDGGWSLQGASASSDADITAMTLQALAPYRARDDVMAAAEAAWGFLSGAQTENGDFYSYGVTCPESGAQVIIALCAWGMDVLDARFVKGEQTLLDGIARYRLDNGCYAHTLDGGENVTATVQVLCAAVAMERAADGRAPFYTIDRTADVVARADLTQPQTADGVVTLDLSEIGGKGWLAIGVVIVALLACFVLFMRGKRGAKHYLSVAILAALALGALLLIDIQTPEQYYAVQDKQNTVGTVTISIRCDTVIGQPGAAHLPSDGQILPEVSVPICEGETVFDILTQVAAEHRLRIQNTGVTASSAALAYVTAINDLKEYDYGDLSGWVYFVNGISPSVGCGEYRLQDGDRITFAYTCNLGEDVGQTVAVTPNS
jgi:hypothetical protein